MRKPHLKKKQTWTNKCIFGEPTNSLTYLLPIPNSAGTRVLSASTWVLRQLSSMQFWELIKRYKKIQKAPILLSSTCHLLSYGMALTRWMPTYKCIQKQSIWSQGFEPQVVCFEARVTKQLSMCAQDRRPIFDNGASTLCQQAKSQQKSRRQGYKDIQSLAKSV